MGYEQKIDICHRITSKGQVTIPKAVRDMLGLEPGQKVMFLTDDDGTVRILSAKAAEKVRRKEFDERMKKAQVIFANSWTYPDLTTDEYMDMVREPLQPFERDNPK